MTWLLSLGVLLVHLWRGGGWTVGDVLAIDGLTVGMWVVVTLFSGIVHSYSRRYMAGDRDITAFFGRMFAFTVVVMILVAADHAVLFAAAWLAMGLVMAELIGHVQDWPDAQSSAALARRYFVASSISLSVALLTFWQGTGATTVSGMITAADDVPRTMVLFGAGALLLAAMIQSALIPFHTWLLSSMTAPTPASALMHGGFVNAGGIVLARFAPVVSIDSTIMLAIVLVGAISALLGKLLKSVQSGVKQKLGCSTVGQMGFMVMQAGLGFFGAAIAHLVLHGFYKAYMFLSSGSRIEHTGPSDASKGSGSLGVAGALTTALTALAGGAIFAGVTGKGANVDSGLVLTLLVVVMTMHATQTVVRQGSLPLALRYGSVPLVFLPAIAVYAGVYNAIGYLMADLPLLTAPTELGAAHVVVGAGFVVAYFAIEAGAYKRSRRLYVALVNAAQPPTATLLTKPEEHNEY